MFEKFGMDDRFHTRMLEQKDLLVLRLRWLSGEKSVKAMYSIKQKQLEEREEQKSGASQSFIEKVVLLETHFSKDFDVYKMSVEKYYTYLDLYKKQNQ